MIPALVIAALAAVVTASANLSGIAALDTSKVLSGEIWRMLSCHLTHLTWRQYAMDAPAFVLLFAACFRRSGFLSCLFLVLFSALSVSSVVVYSGSHRFYGGLSGLSCATLSAVIVAGISEGSRRMSWYFAAIIYSAYLLFMGGIASGVSVAREAHLAGAVSGVAFELIYRQLLGRKRCQAM